MVGAVLPMIWVPRPAWQRIKGGFLETAAWARLLALKLLYDKLNEFQPFLYRGGAFLTALASALLITPVIDCRATLIGDHAGRGAEDRRHARRGY